MPRNGVNAEWTTPSETSPPPTGGSPQSCTDAGWSITPEPGYVCNSPIIVNLSRGPIELTGPEDGVDFDLNADGAVERTAWTATGSSIAFLVMDRNGNGRIDDGSEMFGNHTPLPGGGTAADGYAALAALDANGDGSIDEGEPAWATLRLWIDTNHDGAAQPDELMSPSTAGIISIGYDAHFTGRRDRHGNGFRYEGYCRTIDGAVLKTYDVFFVAAP